MTPQEATQIIGDLTGACKTPRFILSTDGGESSYISFDSHHEAKYYLEHEARGWAKDGEIIDKSYYPQYHLSLDLQVPVWDELGLQLSFTVPSIGGWFAHNYNGMERISYHGDTIQIAAAIATATALQERL